jgi:hypothetical protein
VIHNVLVRPIEQAIATSARVRTQRMLDRLASGVKHCPRCDQTKPLSEFYETPSRAGDHHSQKCRRCTSEVAVAWVRERRSWLRENQALVQLAERLLQQAEAERIEAARLEAERAEAARLRAERAKAARSARQAEASTRGSRFQLPPAPDFSRGLCTTLPATQRTWWTSSDHSERQAAARMCAGCPILAPCEAWAMALPAADNQAVYAGLLPDERLRRKREVLNAIAAQVLARP